MKKVFIKRMLCVGLLSMSLLGFGSFGASAEWRQDSHGWWNADGNSWSVGWKQIDNKWYYFGQDGYMLANTTTPDGFKVDNNGVWIQNNVTTNVNSNNTNTNNTANVSNSVTNVNTNTIGNTNLNNNGLIVNNNNSTTTTTNNNVTVDNTSKEEKDYYKEAKKDQKKIDETMKAYYQKQLDDAKSDLKESKENLEKVKSQNTVKTYKQDKDGNWNFVGVPDQEKIKSCEKQVDYNQSNVDYYEKLVKQYS